MLMTPRSLARSSAEGSTSVIINIANALPQVLAPAVAAGVLGLGLGYSTLYVVAAAVSVLGSILVVNIKSLA